VTQNLNPEKSKITKLSLDIYLVTMYAEHIMGKAVGERVYEFRERMYAAGYKQKQIWVLRRPEDNEKPVKMDRNAFIRKLDELTADMSKARLSKLFIELINLVETKMEAPKAKKK
jgi:hypothetical protein